MEKVQGYLIVLDRPECHKNVLNEKYKGIDRVPAYPSSFEQEEPAMDLYVFGDYKNEEGFIPSLDKALELWRGFSCSPRDFEILFCRDHTFDKSFSANHVYLGYDISSVGGDFWSIVGDFPSHPAMQQYLTSLNNVGLFESASIANSFLDDYKKLELADYDIDFLVFELFRLVI